MNTAHSGTHSKYNSHAKKHVVSKAIMKKLSPRSLSLKPMKKVTKLNKGIMKYVSKKPYQSLGMGAAALMTAAALGLVYLKTKLFRR